MRGVITLQAVKALRPGQEMTDTRLQGFQVRRQGDAITYSVRRRLHGKNVRSTIGRHGPWTPDKARKEAEDRLRDFGKGVNPDIKRKGAGAVFAVVAPLFLQHVEEHLAASTHREYSGHIYDHLLPRFKNKPLDKIATAEVEILHLELKNRRTLANHILATLSSMYGWASGKYVPQGYNPCSGVKRFKETPRNCQLEDEAIERLMLVLRKCEHEGRWSPFALAGIELYLLTGQRRDAIRLARWEHVNWERDEVKVHLKRQGLRTIRLNKQAMTVLRRLRDSFPNDGNPYIIRGTLPGEPYRNMQE
jgi:integrase